MRMALIRALRARRTSASRMDGFAGTETPSLSGNRGRRAGPPARCNARRLLARAQWVRKAQTTSRTHLPAAYHSGGSGVSRPVGKKAINGTRAPPGTAFPTLVGRQMRKCERVSLTQSCERVSLTQAVGYSGQGGRGLCHFGDSR
jgi:hypothetical protein